MKSKLIKLAIIFSLTFNVAVIVTIVYSAYFANRASSDYRSPYRGMNLNDDQRLVIRGEYVETMRRISEMHDQISAKWVESVDMLAQSQPDWKAINAKQQEIQDLHKKTDALILEKWNQLREFVTPEQAQIFLKVLRGEIESGRVFGKVTTEPESPRR